MLIAGTTDGVVNIMEMDGTSDRLVSDIGAIAHKTMLLIANDGAKSAEEVYIRYGALARKLVDYIDTTVKRIDELN